MVADGIIFDLDGTLWDSCKAVSESWQQTIQREFDPARIITEDEIRSIMGMTVEDIAVKLFPGYGASAMDACLACLRDECVYLKDRGGAIYPGLEDALKSLSATAPLFIVSNCLEGYIECFLDFSGFGSYFKDFLNPGITGLSKAGNIRLIVERHALRQAVYVGDTQMDACAAQEAGCPFVHAAYGFGAVAEGTPAVRSPLELAQVISTL